jgi:hypothetical protein
MKVNCKINLTARDVCIICIYRTPTGKFTIFFTGLRQYSGSGILCSTKIESVCGDVNNFVDSCEKKGNN